MKQGNCYTTCEALYHLLGGKKAGYKPMRLKICGEVYQHWFLIHSSGLILDPTSGQFKNKPDYSKAVGCGFLTKNPSAAAKELMKKLVYKDQENEISFD